MPTGVTTSLDIGLSNLSMKTITLSFYSKNISGIQAGENLLTDVFSYV